MEELMTINNPEVITDLDVVEASDSRFMVANTSHSGMTKYFRKKLLELWLCLDHYPTHGKQT